MRKLPLALAIALSAGCTAAPSAPGEAPAPLVQAPGAPGAPTPTARQRKTSDAPDIAVPDRTAAWQPFHRIGKAFVSSGPALAASDGDRMTEWNPRAFITAGKPEWVALPLQSAATAPLAILWHGHSLHYQNFGYGRPRTYEIQVSSDATNGQDGTWRTVTTIEDNMVRSRVSLFEAPGARWVRLKFTATWSPIEREPFLREVAVYQQTQKGAPDVWLILGDSTSSVGLDPAAAEVFAETVAARHPGQAPILIGGGTGGDEAANAPDRLAVALPTLPRGSVIGVCYGSNDAKRAVPLETYRLRLQAAVDTIRAHGHQPVVAVLPWSLNGQVAEYARVCKEVAAANALPPGPDFHTYYKAHPEELEVDRVHPNAAGIRSMQRLWAEAADFRYKH